MIRTGNFVLILLALLLLYPMETSAQTTRDYAFEITATVQESPPRISLHWARNSDARDFVIARKTRNATSWSTLAVLPSTATTYTDSAVQVGQGYEYSITKTPLTSYPASGYIYAGIKLPLVESRGKVLLLVENTHAAALHSELSRLQQDLVGDGWVVLRREVNRNQSVLEIKNLIRNEYNADRNNLKSVFLFGRVPVPYSGNYNADDHDDHTGAWAADLFYADMDGTWTDSTVWNRSATRSENWNVPGDGKFDQSTMPSDVELEIGRVDLANMPAFLPKTETDLLRQYLDKNHRYRHRASYHQRRAVLFDGFGPSGGYSYAASGWRNFAPMVGSANIHTVGWNQFFSRIRSEDYLWTYIAGGGGADYISCYGVGLTSDFVANEIRSVFMMVFGSYFGDWDSRDNFMRAPLGSAGHVLATAWAGRPHWFFHHMALGETIGHSTRVTQNNNGLYQPAFFSRQVHVALMGDPTLRMHVVIPPSQLAASSSAGSVSLTWTRSFDSSLQGYHVYRAVWAGGPYTRVTSAPVTATSYTDSVSSGSYTYMVRAVKLEQSSSGSYYNASQGVFVTVTVPDTPPPPPPPPPATTPIAIAQATRSGSQITFRCNGVSGQKFVLERSTDLRWWTAIATNTLNGTSMEFSDSIVNWAPRRYYRTRLVQE